MNEENMVTIPLRLLVEMIERYSKAEANEESEHNKYISEWVRANKLQEEVAKLKSREENELMIRPAAGSEVLGAAE